MNKNDNQSYSDVFCHLEADLFTALEAAEYLEVSIEIFSGYLKEGKIVALSESDKKTLYSLCDLRQFKKNLLDRQDDNHA